MFRFKANFKSSTACGENEKLHLAQKNTFGIITDLQKGVLCQLGSRVISRTDCNFFIRKITLHRACHVESNHNPLLSF